MCEDAIDLQSNFCLTFHVLYTIHNCAVFFLYHCALLFEQSRDLPCLLKLPADCLSLYLVLQQNQIL